MILREATVADLDAIMQLERASFRGDAWSDAVMRAELDSEHTWYVVAEDADRVIGYAGLRAPSGSPDADVQTIALAEAARGRGQGRALLQGLLAQAASRRVREVFLDVRDDNAPAQALYASEGFVEIGRRPNYYPDGNVAAIVMRLDVASWTAAKTAAKTAASSAAGETATTTATAADAGAST